MIFRLVVTGVERPLLQTVMTSWHVNVIPSADVKYKIAAFIPCCGAGFALTIGSAVWLDALFHFHQITIGKHQTTHFVPEILLVDVFLF